MLYKFINATHIQECPLNGHIEGRAISNLPRFFESHPEAAKAAGYKPLTVAEQPDYNPETQHLTATYKENKASISKRWVVNDNPTPPAEDADLETRVAALEDKFKTAEAAGGIFSTAKAAEDTAEEETA